MPLTKVQSCQNRQVGAQVISISTTAAALVGAEMYDTCVGERAEGGGGRREDCGMMEREGKKYVVAI